jgi:hypothetical protein
MPDLGSLATAAVAALATVVALRLIYLTIIGFARPSIAVEPVQSTTGKEEDEHGIQELIEAELSALREEGGGPSLLLMTTPDAAIAIGEIEAGGGPLKQFGALLKLLPGRTRVLSGQMQAAGALGQGITLTLRTSTNRVASTVTLWERQYVSARDLPADIAADGEKDKPATAEARECLGLAAAAWTAYRALEGSTAAERVGLLTQDWESYALFRVGARMQFLGLFALARRLYLDALARDPRNRGALFNLAIIDIREQNERAAIERLKAALGELTTRNPLRDIEPWLFDRLWYRANYNIIAAEWNQAVRTGTVAEAREPIKARIRTIVKMADRTMDRLGGEDALDAGGRFADLVRFLVDVRAAAIAVYSDAVYYPARGGPAPAADPAT